MRIAALVLSAAVLVGCTEVQQAVDKTARQGTKGVVSEVLATRFPQVPKPLFETFVDCVIDNSDASEVQTYVKAAVSGVTDATAETVKTVLSRPETQACLSQRALDAGLI